MFTNVKKMIDYARIRKKARRAHQDLTRSLDALALTELGYPPKTLGAKERGWFLYL